MKKIYFIALLYTSFLTYADNYHGIWIFQESNKELYIEAIPLKSNPPNIYKYKDGITRVQINMTDDGSYFVSIYDIANNGDTITILEFISNPRGRSHIEYKDDDFYLRLSYEKHRNRIKWYEGLYSAKQECYVLFDIGYLKQIDTNR